MICTGTWRVMGSCFSSLKTLQPSNVGQQEIERDRRGLVLARHFERLAPAPGDEHLEARVARQVHEHAPRSARRPRR
jgi:hypothetical protein